MASVKYVKISSCRLVSTDKAELFEIKTFSGDRGYEFWIPKASNYVFKSTGGNFGYLYCSEKVFKSKWESNKTRGRYSADYDDFFGDERYVLDEKTKSFVVVDAKKKYVPPKKPSIGKIDVTSDTAHERRTAKGWNYDKEEGIYVSINALLAMKEGAYTAFRASNEFGVSAAFIYWAFTTSEKHHVNKESGELFDFFCTRKIRKFISERPKDWLKLVSEFYGQEDKTFKREKAKLEKKGLLK